MVLVGETLGSGYRPDPWKKPKEFDHAAQPVASIGPPPHRAPNPVA
jgi:hypothetical protein